MTRLLAFFVIVPAIELYLLIQIGAVIGALETFGIIVLTGLLGSYLAKSQGLATLRQFQQKLASGQIPGKELADGAIILISGAFLLTPGVLTDFVGLLGLFPLTRPYIRKWIQPWLQRFLQSNQRTGSMNFGANYNMRYRTSTEESADINLGDPAKTTVVSGKAREKPQHNK